MGARAWRLPNGGSSIRLPTFKDEGGTWRPAIRIRDEVRGPLADTVLTFLLEEGLARRKFEPSKAAPGCLTVDYTRSLCPRG
jgi:hypothetical protein